MVAYFQPQTWSKFDWSWWSFFGTDYRWVLIPFRQVHISLGSISGRYFISSSLEVSLDDLMGLRCEIEQ
jgi:hypothetical protein